jgi:hypothetical protein
LLDWLEHADGALVLRTGGRAVPVSPMARANVEQLGFCKLPTPN